ncbi:MAG: zf-HC2 domain-containing protein [Desulfomonilaceae bacterium]
MSECERISGLFGELHDDEADNETERVVRKHLHSCPGCREDFKWYGLTVQALTSMERVAPPRDFIAQLNVRLNDDPPSSIFKFFRNIFWSTPYVPLPVGVPAIAFIAVVGFVFYNYAPTGIMPSVASHSPWYQSNSPSSKLARMAPLGTGATVPGRLPASTVVATSEITPSTPSTHLPLLSKAIPNSLSSNIEAESRGFPTIADRIGADNLTVESASVDRAVASLKRILPDIQGRLVDEPHRGNVEEVVVGVMIPSDAYGNLTTELINHGAVAAGLESSDVRTPSPAKKEGNNVLLYIRFVPSR